MKKSVSLVSIVTLTMLLFGGCGDGVEFDDSVSQLKDNGYIENSQTQWQNTTIIYSSHNESLKKLETNDYTLLAWSESGMHCMDGSDYSVFSILPPYSTLKAQLLVNGASPRLVNSDVSITYEAVQKDDGSINSTSTGKTNFWNYLPKLFPKAGSIDEDKGLKGKPTQSTQPEPMDYNRSYNVYIAEGIPTVPQNDDGKADEYPMVKVVAKDKSGNILAQTTTVLPVSDEMNCAKCHSSKINVLQKHDRNFPNAVKDNKSALAKKGFVYNDAGLKATANGGTPVLCASCHKTGMIKDSGISGVKPLTEAMHGAHAYRNDPETGTLLGDSSNRHSCYSCHPGESTKCLRGAMGSAEDSNGDYKIDCQSCHGSMEAVAQHSREGWSDEPNCQACHQDGKRYDKAVTDTDKGTLRAALDTRFATEKTPADTDNRLYKHSMGHGGVACAGCHGSQHAIYPSSLPEDNAQNIKLQGYKGTLRECGVCHKNDRVVSVANGPHGIHTVGQKWVDIHGTVVLRDGTSNCKSCHGSDLGGSVLSKVGTDRIFKLGVMKKEIGFKAGESVACNKCHNDNIMGVSQ